ncbi:uncharacterized protein LOC129592415 [Paramacrobiotus metropolitanus]|uniref:uncharacterized protein LOC129592415 n=1 Tax=Paramacrobiotus metropolitanus TaxID=2943436 RepID=UPI0024458F7F|nr:uncharacterized protein LOC129592415 [Paramacrobiotus metropolitanus]
MDITLQQLGRFRGVPKIMLLFFISVLITLPISLSTRITASELGDDSILPGTFDLCPNSELSDTELRNATGGRDDFSDLAGVVGIRFDTRPSFSQPFETYLEVKESLLRHYVTLQINNRTVTELQDAITYAWLPSLEKSNWTAVHAQILNIENGSLYFSPDGSPLMSVCYVMPPPVTDAISSANSSRIVPLSMDDFKRRLQDKGLAAYDGQKYPATTAYTARDSAYLRANATSGVFDTDQLKADVMGIVQRGRRRDCGDARVDDVEIHFGNLEPGIVPYKSNGTYSDVRAMRFPFLLIVQKKNGRRFRLLGIDLSPLNNHTDRYYPSVLGMMMPVNPAYSFRLYLDRPLNVQWLPGLQALMTSQLNVGNTSNCSAEVRVWDFDPNGWVVNFVVTLRFKTLPQWIYVVDGRLLHSATIYRKLDGFQFRVLLPASSPYRLTRYPAQDSREDTIKAATLRNCRGETQLLPLPVEELTCPVTAAFTLYVERMSKPSVFAFNPPDAGKILDAVQRAFAIANPVVMDNITLSITLTGRDTNLPTTGRDVTKFSFALTYPKMQSGLYWNLWRYPSLDELNGSLQRVADVKIVQKRTTGVQAFP